MKIVNLRKNTLKKKERLRSRKEIDHLFKNSLSLFVYPIKVLYQINFDEKNSGASVLFTMSHKKFKLAVHRNQIKRQLKEAYRINNENLVTLLKKKNFNAKIALIYIADSVLSHKEIEYKVQIVLKNLCKLIEQENINQ